jgi:Fe-S cluster biosynthesis and repair protein YggX
MKIIINEYHLGLLRRIGMVEDLIDPMMDDTYTYLQGEDNITPLDKGSQYKLFESVVVMALSNKLANQTSLVGDEKVTLRNQLQRYITNEYHQKMKDYFYDRLKMYGH